MKKELLIANRAKGWGCTVGRCLLLRGNSLGKEALLPRRQSHIGPNIGKIRYVLTGPQ